MTEENDAVPHDGDDTQDLTDAHQSEDVWVCPLTGETFKMSEIEESRKKQELVRQQCVREYSKSPLYQAAAAKDPDYWKDFSIGQAHLYDEDKGEA